MNWMGFFIFNSICDTLSSIVEDSKCPPRGTKEYDRAVKGSIAVVIIGIIAIVLFFYALSLE